MPSAPPPQRGFALRGHDAKLARRRREDGRAKVEGAITLKERQAAGRIPWDLLDLLRGELTGLQDRARFVIPIQITGLIGLWVQIASFDAGPSRDLALVALGVLLASIFISLLLVRPSASPVHWERMVDGLSAEDADVTEIQAEIVATLFRSWEKEATRMRRCVLYATGLGTLALVLAIAAYIVDLSRP
jgi:hypothetical protein